MSSGFGLNGYEASIGTRPLRSVDFMQGRCYQFWREYQGCLTEKSGDTKQCGDHIEDYMECLHHRKEIQRNNAIVVHAHDKVHAAKDGGSH